MSLISEALKKARQEAARQDALHRGAPYAVGAVEAPRRNPVMPLLAGLGAGCLLGGILFATTWIGGWGPFAKPAPPAPPIQVAQAPPPAAPPVSSATPLPLPPAVEVREETPVAPVPLPPPQATAPVAPPSDETRPAPQPVAAVPEAPPPPTEVASPVQEPIASPPVQEPATVTPVPSTQAPTANGLEEGKVYAGEIPVPGGGTLKLNGIAYSQERPVVVLDGRVMGTGETIQGFTVVAIEAGRVKLQGHGATVFLSPN